MAEFFNNNVCVTISYERICDLKKFFYKDDGVIAVEFAFIAFPMIFMIVGIIELGLLFGSATMLERGTIEAARSVRTGQIQDSVDPEAAFAAELCARVNTLINCSGLLYEVVLIPDQDFLQVGDYPPQYDADGNLLPRSFDPGGPSDVVLIRASYKYPFLTGLLTPLLANNGEETVRFVSTVVLRNEPYELI